jgi:hypothetical protein
VLAFQFGKPPFDARTGHKSASRTLSPFLACLRIADNMAVDVLSTLWAICHKSFALCLKLSVCPVHAQGADRRYDAFGIAVTNPKKIVIES